MVFKNLARRFGVGGPSVDTVLSRPDTQPGRTLSGQVNITGGDHDVEIEHVVVGLAVRAETEVGDHESAAAVEFTRMEVAGNFQLAPGEERVIPFEMATPWETPITHVYGQNLRGMAVGMRTELAVAKAIDKGDLDPVNVHPLASQETVLEAFEQLGFRFKSADVELGRIAGLRQELPFYQEIEYFPPREFAGRIGAVELTFVADAHGMAVVLEADRRGGAFGGGGDSFGRFHVSHDEAEEYDWAAVVKAWLAKVAERSSGHHGHGGGRGMGAGGMIAGAAGGAVGGMILGGMLGDAGEGLFGGGE
ncbi:MAG: sporulation protein [Stackebrandtia sp.]